jgi:surface antigen
VIKTRLHARIYAIRLTIAATALVALTHSASTIAVGNIGFLKDTPLTRFSGPDQALLETNVTEALNSTADGEVRHWQNPNTGSSGEIAILKSLDQQGKRCRQTRITNRARGYSEAKTDFLFCLEPDGRWKVASPAKEPVAP